MIDRLRKKFIRICMLSFCLVFFLLFAAVYIATSLQTDASLDALADIVSQYDGRFPDFEEFGGEDGLLLPPEGVNRESPFTTRFFTVRFDSSGGVLSLDVRSIASVTEEEAEAYAALALSSGRSRGWLESFRYKVYDTEEGAAVVFISGAEARAGNRRFFLSSASVFVGGSLVVLLLVMLFSKRAVKPTAESYEKQKQFITDANHELKTPLTLIRTNLDILEAENGPNEWLSDVREETERMTELVDRLVLLSRMDEDQARPELRPFSLSEATAEVAASFAPLLHRSGKSLSTEIAPEVACTGDEGSMRQLISILLDNAVKYSDAGSWVRVALTGGRHPALTVDNRCAAVGTMELHRLFDRFYRSDKARTYGSGFGVGLSIAKAIAEQHRGELTVSSPREGVIRFRLRL